jgi:hypothetical protein
MATSRSQVCSCKALQHGPAAARMVLCSGNCGEARQCLLGFLFAFQRAWQRLQHSENQANGNSLTGPMRVMSACPFQGGHACRPHLRRAVLREEARQAEVLRAEADINGQGMLTSVAAGPIRAMSGTIPMTVPTFRYIGSQGLRIARQRELSPRRQKDRGGHKMATTGWAPLHRKDRSRSSGSQVRATISTRMWYPPMWRDNGGRRMAMSGTTILRGATGLSIGRQI